MRAAILIRWLCLMLTACVTFAAAHAQAVDSGEAPPPAELENSVPRDDAAPDAADERAPIEAPPPRRDPVDDAQARRALTTAVVMLGGILICGVGLIAIVLIWGNRTRRIARQSLPNVAPRDELWYLKNKLESETKRADETDSR